MGCLTLGDLLIKIASQTLPLGQVMIVFGVGSITVFLGLMRLKGRVCSAIAFYQSRSGFEKYW